MAKRSPKKKTKKKASRKKPGMPMRSETQQQRPKSVRRAYDHAGHVPEPYNDKERGERLQKVLAELGVASRRDCEEFIQQGRVKVDGVAVTGLPAWVDLARDRIEFDGETISSPRGRGKRGPKRHVYIMLHKPRRTISTVDDDQDRRTVLDLVKVEGHLPMNASRLYPVGRLDSESTGLILLTNDGQLTKALTHPASEVPKTYRVTIKGSLSDEDVQKLRDGIYLTHQTRTRKGVVPKKASAAKVVKLGVQRDRTRGDRTALRMTLTEGQNREIRRLVAALGYKVQRLHREAIGPLKLKGVALGQWRILTESEIRSLRRVVKAVSE